MPPGVGGREGKREERGVGGREGGEEGKRSIYGLYTCLYNKLHVHIHAIQYKYNTCTCNTMVYICTISYPLGRLIDLALVALILIASNGSVHPPQYSFQL